MSSIPSDIVTLWGPYRNLIAVKYARTSDFVALTSTDRTMWAAHPIPTKYLEGLSDPERDDLRSHLSDIVLTTEPEFVKAALKTIDALNQICQKNDSHKDGIRVSGSRPSSRDHVEECTLLEPAIRQLAASSPSHTRRRSLADAREGVRGSTSTEPLLNPVLDTPRQRQGRSSTRRQAPRAAYPPPRNPCGPFFPPLLEDVVSQGARDDLCSILHHYEQEGLIRGGPFYPGLIEELFRTGTVDDIRAVFGLRNVDRLFGTLSPHVHPRWLYWAE